jgi:acyl-CoA thioesterase FadM
MNETTWQPLRALTYRGFVYPSQLDPNGCMHASNHAARYDEASWNLFGLLGLGPQRLSARRQNIVTLEQRIVYDEHVGAAAVVHIDSELLELGATTLRYRHVLCNSETRQTISTMERLSALIGLDQRGPTTLSPALVHRAQVLFPAAAILAGANAVELAAARVAFA